jgi:hypothetical protein
MGGAATAESRAAALIYQEGALPSPPSKRWRRSPAGPARSRAAAANSEAASVIFKGVGLLQDDVAPATL